MTGLSRGCRFRSCYHAAMRQETELVPYTTTRLSGSPLLVLAPHPDDEMFGGGPLLIEAVRSGAEAHVIIVTDGVAQGDRETRREESREAARRLGAPEPEFWSFADRSLDPSDEAFLAAIRRALDRFEPQLLGIPSPAELHPDHRATALAVYRALREPGRLESLPEGFRLVSYEISAFLRPNALVDLTGDWPALCRAFEAFGSQNEVQPYLEVLDAVAVARRLTLGPEVERAAAFFVCDAAFIGANDAETWAAVQGPVPDPEETAPGAAEITGGKDGSHGPREPDEPETPAVRVSVVVRTKDRPERLAEALESLAVQKHRPLEVVVVNDGGTDVSGIVGAFEDRLEIVHERLDPGRGRSAAANRGIELASGPWLAFLDDDDLWLPGGIARLLAAVPSRNSVVYGRVGAWKDGAAKPFMTFGRPFDRDALLFENFIPIIGCLMPLDTVRSIGGIDESLECFEDWDLFIRLSESLPFLFVESDVARYRIFGDGFITGGGGQELQHRGRTAVLEKHRDKLTPETLSRMQFFAKGTLIPEAIERETREWRRRVEDLERGVRNFEDGVADLRRQLTDRDARLERESAERQAVEEQLAKTAARCEALTRDLERDPVRSTLVSVIIVNYNGRHHLERCLPSLARTSKVPFEVIVVDNGSEDDSVAWVREHHPEVRIIEIGANVGFGEGNRQGVLAARGAYVAFLNSDTEVEPGWLYELIRTLCLDPRIAAACSTLTLMEHPELLNGRGGGMSKLGYGYDRHYGCPVDQDDDVPAVRDVFFPTAAAMAMSTHDFLATGGFDRKIFMYHEDVDLGWRLWLLGRRVVVCRDSVVLHHFGGTSHGAKGLEWRERMGSRHTVRSILKHGEPVTILKAFKGLAKFWIGIGAWRHIAHVVFWNLYRSPSTAVERFKIQRRRHMKDSEFFRRGFISPSPYPAPHPEIRSLQEPPERWVRTPVLRPGLHSALGRLGPGWYAPHPIEDDMVRPFCGDARCALRVEPGATGALEIDLHVPEDAVRDGAATVGAGGVETSVALTGESWQKLRLEGVVADEDGIIRIRLRTPSFRPHEIFSNWDFRRLGGAVRRVEFLPDDPPAPRDPSGVSVVITTFRRWPVLEITLDALRAQTVSGFQVVVMDDGSGDETWERLQAYRDAHANDVRLTIATQENSGQGTARNNALALVEEDLVLFLGDDIIPERELIERHIQRRRLVGEPCAVVGFTDWYRKEMKVTPFMDMVNTEGHQFGYDHMISGADQPFTCFYTSNISIDREILGERPFDPAFSSYGWEDIELGYRLSLRGVRIIYEEKARAGHFHPTDIRSFYRRQLQVGRTHPDILAIHPELIDSPHMPPRRPPTAYRLVEPFAGALVPLADALDRRMIPVPRKFLHHLMMVGFFKGRREAVDGR